MAKEYSSKATQAIHAGELRPRVLGAVSLPVFQSSTYEFGGERSYDDLKYIRMNNTPNHEVLHAKLAVLEGGEDALVAASGMGIIATTFLSFLRNGDHILAQDCLYGGTYDFIRQDLAPLGISCDFVNCENPAEWQAKLRPETKLFYCESITNPLMDVVDLEAVAAFCRANKLISLIDNTFATPINFRPLEIGFDLALHSGTKYLNGHSDIVAGAVAGSAELVGTVRHKLIHLGASLDPHACHLLHRGLKTLDLRMQRHNRNGQQIAEFLYRHPAVVKVNYPGLESHAQHARAARLFSGHSGMISFELLGGRPAADRLLDHVETFIVAPSLGGVESLITIPATTSHVGLTPEQRRASGITESLVRLSIGIEAADDLIADLEQALRHA